MLECDEPYIASHKPSAGAQWGHDKIFNLDIPDHGGGENIELTEQGVKVEELDSKALKQIEVGRHFGLTHCLLPL